MTPQREWFEKDYYEVLGVPPTASAKDVSRAYKKLAKRYHPDAHPGDTAAEERFKDVSAAYDVLHDTEKRKEYDEVRQMVAAGVAGPGGGRPGWSQAGPAGAPFEGVHFEFGDEADLGDIFGHLFGGAPRGRRAGAQRGRDVQTEITLPFADAVEGTTRSVRFTAGDGSHDVKVRIPRGVANGQRIRVGGRGEPGHGGPAGDLYVVVHVLPHPLVGRDGLDLTLDLPVTFAEATLGGDVKVPTLDEPVTVRIAAGTPSGKVLRVRGRGIEDGKGRRGDLLVSVQVHVPTDLDPAQRAAVEALAEQLPDDPRAGLSL